MRFCDGVGAVKAQAENLDVNGLGGDDTINAGNGLATLTKLTIDGGDGNDTIGGGDGADFLIGGPGDDTVDGNRGNDVAFLGDGNDVFVWDPGDGSDVVEGQAGQRHDALQRREHRREDRPLCQRLPAPALPRRREHHDGHERRRTVQVNALGGADTVTVGDLAGTSVTSVEPTSPRPAAAATASPTG